jgi:hypothetical protein
MLDRLPVQNLAYALAESAVTGLNMCWVSAPVFQQLQVECCRFLLCQALYPALIQVRNVTHNCHHVLQRSLDLLVEGLLSTLQPSCECIYAGCYGGSLLLNRLPHLRQTTPTTTVQREF